LNISHEKKALTSLGFEGFLVLSLLRFIKDGMLSKPCMTEENVSASVGTCLADEARIITIISTDQ